MKRLIITALITLFMINVSAQKFTGDFDLKIEVIDTVQTAYNHYFTGNWIQSNFSMIQEQKKDSIGLDSVRIKRIYYVIKSYEKISNKFDKVYIGWTEIEYLTPRLGNDYPKLNF